jgi:hypothetical protein
MINKKLFIVVTLAISLPSYALIDAAISGFITGVIHSMEQGSNSEPTKNSDNSNDGDEATNRPTVQEIISSSETKTSNQNLFYIKANSNAKLYVDNSNSAVKRNLDDNEVLEVLFSHWAGRTQVKVNNETGWVQSENIVDSNGNGIYLTQKEQKIKPNPNHKNPTDRWSKAAKEYIKPIKSVRGTVIAIPQKILSDADVTLSKSNDIEKFLNSFSNKERATNVAPVIYNYGGVGQTMQSDELIDSLDDLRRQQKTALRRQSQEMKRMLEQQNREQLRQRQNYDLINNWKPINTYKYKQPKARLIRSVR